MSNSPKVLVSAYACEPNKGSEPGIGWNWVLQIARYNRIWVITRESNRESIDQEITKLNTAENINWIYFDLPRWLRFWKRGNRGVQLYYYLWQMGAYFVGKRYHRRINFDLLHHVTFTRYWTPSFLSFLDIPFIWGPVGGGESTPPVFYKTFGLKAKLYEFFRIAARAIGHIDLFVRKTSRKACLAIATSDETAEKISSLGVQRIVVHSNVGLPEEDIRRLTNLPLASSMKTVFFSVGRLLHWKGFHLGLLAFAQLNNKLDSCEYWIFGDGTEKKNLERLTIQLEISERVHFWGNLKREELLSKISECNVLVHPSLHDSGGWVCAEAMAAQRPLICLDLGGPALQVTEETGFKIPAISPEQVVKDMAEAMLKLAKNPELARQMGEAGRKRVAEHFSWEKKGEFINRVYQEILGNK